MSFKYQVQKINPNERILERGVSKPIRIFVNYHRDKPGGFRPEPLSR